MPSTGLLTTVPRRGPVKRTVASIFVLVLCYCAICGKVLLDGRRAALEHAAEVATSLAGTLETDIARDIESFDLSLHAVIDNLANPEITKISPDLRQLVLFDRSASARHLEAIILIDENGIGRLDSRTPFPRPVDRSDRSYFQFHKNSTSHELHISEPIATRETNTPVIVVSRRLSNPDGSFAGVVAGSIRLSYFEQLFRRASLGAGGNITLVRMDGTLLMRSPYEPRILGSSLRASELYKHLAAARSGQFESTSSTDGVRRLVVYGQIGDLPIFIGVGQSTQDIYARWFEYALSVGALMLVLCATSVALSIYLAREMQRRADAETKLAVLATTDSLTGLSNRLQWQQAFDREWRRATRDRSSVALLMCDSDHFKSYNDQHGHQAGDRLLQAIGSVMHRNIRRATDIAARYGGDEFALLLPATTVEVATRLAEHLRSGLLEACDRQGIPRSHLSVGVASMVPHRGDDQSVLLAAADQALYRAKELGRDRIEVAPPQVSRPTLVVENAAA